MKLTIFKPFFSAIILIVFTLLGCTDMFFDSPQPSWVTKNEKEIPKKFRGNYLSGNGQLNRTHKEDDTIRISEKRIYISEEYDFTLSDTVLLKSYKNEYFLNVYYSEVNVWRVIRVKEEKENILVYMMYTTDSTRENQFNKITDFRRIPQSSDEFPCYLINPSSREFKKILKGNLFNAGDTLVRIK